MGVRVQCPAGASFLSVQGQQFTPDSEGAVLLPNLSMAEELIKTGLGYKMARGSILVSDDVAGAIKAAQADTEAKLRAGSGLLGPDGQPLPKTVNSITSTDPFIDAIETVANKITTTEMRVNDPLLSQDDRQAAMDELMKLGQRFSDAQRQAQASFAQAAHQSTETSTSPETPGASPAGAGSDDSSTAEAGSDVNAGPKLVARPTTTTTAK